MRGTYWTRFLLEKKWDLSTSYWRQFDVYKSGWPLVLKCPESPEMSWKMKKNGNVLKLSWNQCLFQLSWKMSWKNTQDMGNCPEMSWNFFIFSSWHFGRSKESEKYNNLYSQVEKNIYLVKIWKIWNLWFSSICV